MAVLTRLVAFLNILDGAKIPYFLGHVRDDSVMVSFAVVGERYEIDFSKIARKSRFSRAMQASQLTLRPC